MMVKEPRVGGAWEWHQDYGYWYNNGALYPDMASCMIAVDRAHAGNGCLQVLKGSHRIGRIEHGRYGTQTGAHPERVALAEQHLERVYCEMNPGSALFFHANLLHCSDANESEDPRWSLICCYNTRHNPCDDKPGHPSYQPLEKWDDGRVVEMGRQHTKPCRMRDELETGCVFARVFFCCFAVCGRLSCSVHTRSGLLNKKPFGIDRYGSYRIALAHTR